MGTVEHRKRKERRVNTKSDVSIGGGGGSAQASTGRHFNKKIFGKGGGSERRRKPNKRNFNEGPRRNNKDAAAVHRPAHTSKLHKHKKMGQR